MIRETINNILPKISTNLWGENPKIPTNLVNNISRPLTTTALVVMEGGEGENPLIINTQILPHQLTTTALRTSVVMDGKILSS